MPLRILLLTHYFFPDLGGIETNSEVLAGAFVKAGHQVRVVTWSADNTRTVFPYQVIRKPTKNRLLREHRWADVIFENNPCLRLSWPRLLIPRPSVIALNTWLSRPDGRLAFQDKMKLKWLYGATKVIAVSDAIRRRVFPAAEVIGNPCRPEFSATKVPTEQKKEFVFLGRLVSDKGVRELINAFHKLLTRLTEYGSTIQPSLTIIGEGPEYESLKQMTAKFNLKEKVHFAGRLIGKELAACLSQHRFILIPSVWEEPFGNVALEGMTCGCLPIGSNGGGLPFAIGKAGLLFERGNIDALAECMEKVLLDPEIEMRLKTEVPGHLLLHHPDTVAAAYLKVIESSINPS